MSGSDRGGFNTALAAVLTVGALLAVVTAFALGWDMGRQPETYPRYEYARQDQAGAQPAPRANVQPREYKQPCRNPQGQDESDLCAQYRAANNAGSAERWAFWQLLVSGFGIIGLGLTIGLTIRATNAAVRSNEIAMRQVRPHLYIGDVKLNVPITQESRLDIPVKNHGQMTATNVRVGIAAHVTPRPIGDHARDMEISQWDNVVTLAPQAQTVQFMGLGVFEPGEWELLENGTVAIVLRIVFDYEGLDGLKDREDITIFIDEDSLKTGEVLVLNEYARKYLGKKAGNEED